MTESLVDSKLSATNSALFAIGEGDHSSAGEPFVEILLTAVSCGPMVGVVQPGEEFDRLGHSLLGR